MGDRLTTVSTVAAALVATGAVLCGAVPADAVVPTPVASPSSTAAVAAAATPSPAPSATPAPTRAGTVVVAVTPRPTATPVVSRPVAPTTPATVPTAAPATTAPVVPTPPPMPVPVLTPTPTPTPIVPPPVADRISVVQGHTSKSRTVTLTGSQLLNLRDVRVAGVLVSGLVVLSDTTARFVLPNAVDYQAKVAPITLTARADGITRPTALTFTYVVQGRVDRQMAYAFQNWNVYSNTAFGYLAGNDCANFTSQTLLARGWKRSRAWFDYGPGRWSSTWVSSTALSTWLKKRPDLATRLGYRDRDQVVVGDVIQFRWPGHKKNYSSWDHTGIVSKVVVLPNGRHDVYYTAHTLNRQYGGSTQILATVMAKDLRIQFFHLLK